MRRSAPVTDHPIEPDNIHAAAAIYFAETLEEMRLFDAVDLIVDQFRDGAIPISRGAAAKSLYVLFKQRSLRLSREDRHRLYNRVLGRGDLVPDVEVRPNADFDRLWMRFLTDATALARAEPAPPAMIERAVSAARELAANLSLHGHGMALYASAELDETIAEVVELLSRRPILEAYDAPNIWGVVEVVAEGHLGVRPDTSRLAAMARSGRKILDWLADAEGLGIGGMTRAGILLRDPKLVRNIERWLASNSPAESR